MDSITSNVVNIFSEVMDKLEGKSLESAILTACIVTVENFERLDHKLCMGIRKGLFGADASNNDSLEGLNLIDLDDLKDVFEVLKPE